jgi:hypothetical protein
MENQISNQQDEELEEATKGLEPHDGSEEDGKFEDIGEIKPEEPQLFIHGLTDDTYIYSDDAFLASIFYTCCALALRTERHSYSCTCT